MAYYIEPAPVLTGEDAERFTELLLTAKDRQVAFSKEEKESFEKILEASKNPVFK